MKRGGGRMEDRIHSAGVGGDNNICQILAAVELTIVEVLAVFLLTIRVRRSIQSQQWRF